MAYEARAGPERVPHGKPAMKLIDVNYNPKRAGPSLKVPQSGPAALTEYDISANI